MRPIAVLLGVTLLLLAPIRSARAQWTNPYTGGTWNNPGSSLLDTMIQNKIIGDSVRRHAGRKKGEEAAPAARPVKRRPMSATDFKPAKKPLLPASLGGTAEEQALTAMILEQTLASFADDLRPHNVAWAFVFVIGACLHVDRGADLDPDAAKAWAAEINDLLAAQPGFRKMKARDRQLLHEYFMLSGGLVLMLHQQAKADGDEQQIAAARKLARGFLEQLGVE